MKAKIISMMNYKGGCTKTSSVVGLGSALALTGNQVLIVDCDPQSHAGIHLGIEEDELDVAIENVLGVRGMSIADIVVGTGDSNMWLAPSRRALLHARYRLEGRAARETLLAKALKTVEGEYDFILIDTPPDEGILSLNAMYASHYVIIPTPLDVLSLHGINPLLDTLESLREAYDGHAPDILGVLINKHDERLRTVNKQNMEDIQGLFGELVFDTRIRADEEVRKAQLAGKSIFQWKQKAKSAADFTELASEVMSRVG